VAGQPAYSEHLCHVAAYLAVALAAVPFELLPANHCTYPRRSRRSRLPPPADRRLVRRRAGCGQHRVPPAECGRPRADAAYRIRLRGLAKPCFIHVGPCGSHFYRYPKIFVGGNGTTIRQQRLHLVGGSAPPSWRSITAGIGWRLPGWCCERSRRPSVLSSPSAFERAERSRQGRSLDRHTKQHDERAAMRRPFSFAALMSPRVSVRGSVPSSLPRCSGTFGMVGERLLPRCGNISRPRT
jgi:hypothetical protein